MEGLVVAAAAEGLVAAGAMEAQGLVVVAAMEVLVLKCGWCLRTGLAWAGASSMPWLDGRCAREATCIDGVAVDAAMEGLVAVAAAAGLVVVAAMEVLVL